MSGQAKPDPAKTADPGQYLPLLARAAADRARTRKRPLSRSQALAEAPWDKSMPPAWESAFRAAYADQMQKRGAALPAAKSGNSGAGGRTELVQCRLYLGESEYEAQKALAKRAGVSWSTWARRKLAT